MRCVLPMDGVCFFPFYPQCKLNNVDETIFEGLQAFVNNQIEH